MGPLKRKNVRDIAAAKHGVPLVALTSYTPPIAALADPYVDILLVGDSLGMVHYGFESTLPVTLDMMIAHAAAVRRMTSQALVVVDMPFGSYQASPEQAFEHSARVMKESGCDAVKLEGGVVMAPTIAYLVARGIPVMGHVGLQPQQVHQMGGYRTQGRTEAEAAQILADAQAVEEAGAFCLVLEGIKETLARQITAACSIPTIGIGASASCDGQVLVTEDMLGLTATDYLPRFVKRYADLAAPIRLAMDAYAKEVRARSFPGAEHVYGGK